MSTYSEQTPVIFIFVRRLFLSILHVRVLYLGAWQMFLNFGKKNLTTVPSWPNVKMTFFDLNVYRKNNYISQFENNLNCTLNFETIII